MTAQAMQTWNFEALAYPCALSSACLNLAPSASISEVSHVSRPRHLRPEPLQAL
jgi:hypothetical protein